MDLNIKSQSAIEFIMVLAAVMLLVSLFFIALNDRIDDKTKERNNLEIKQIALIVQEEVNYAYKSQDGYQRSFQISNLANGKEYSLNVTDNSIYLITNDKKEAMSLPLAEINGNVKKGNNTIKRNESGIFLNYEN